MVERGRSRARSRRAELSGQAEPGGRGQDWMGGGSLGGLLGGLHCSVASMAARRHHVALVTPLHVSVARGMAAGQELKAFL